MNEERTTSPQREGAAEEVNLSELASAAAESFRGAALGGTRSFVR